MVEPVVGLTMITCTAIHTIVEVAHEVKETTGRIAH